MDTSTWNHANVESAIAKMHEYNARQGDAIEGVQQIASMVAEAMKGNAHAAFDESHASSKAKQVELTEHVNRFATQSATNHQSAIASDMRGQQILSL